MPKSTRYVAKQPDAAGHIAYTPEEDLIWRDLFARQQPAVDRHAAPEFRAGQARLNLPADRVPQCTEISATLRDLTGWQVAPVPALIGFSTFFGMLAERTFPAASFLRDRQDFDYIEEPDIFHEIYGHTPLLTDPRFADFSQAIGRAGVACDKADHSWLIRLYWFTIEFGLIRTADGIRALGSGLASSPQELTHALTDPSVVYRPFDVIDILRTPYRIDIPQPLYFVLDDADQLLAAADRDLSADIARARQLGLHAPLYAPQKKAG